MAFDDEDSLRELFSAFGPIAVRRMFSGKGVYSDGVHFALSIGGTVYLRADEEIVPMFQAEGSKPFTYTAKGREIVVNYWSVSERCYDEPEELVPFARAALNAAKWIAAKKAKPRKPAAPKSKRPVRVRAAKKQTAKRKTKRS